MTGYTVPIEKGMACAKTMEKVSTVAAQTISKRINGMELKDAKAFLEKLAAKRVSINNKFHTNAAECILVLVNAAENNAITKGLDIEALAVIAAAHKGPKMFRGRRKRAFGMRMKATHVQIVLKPFQKKAKPEKAVESKKLAEMKKENKTEVKKAKTADAENGKKEEKMIKTT